MTVPSESRFPRIARREHEPHIPSQLEYVRIAVFLAIVTALEVLLYYFYGNIAKVVLIAALVVLAAIKFITVVSFFMHLRFDGRLLSFIFCTGLVLAGGVFLIAIVTIHAIA